MLEVRAARHVIDAVPFSLWDAQDREFRPPDESQWEWLFEKFNAQTISLRSWYMWIETDKPSQSIPLTIACKPVMFVGTGARTWKSLPESHHSNPRIEDPVSRLVLAKDDVSDKRTEFFFFLPHSHHSPTFEQLHTFRGGLLWSCAMAMTDSTSRNPYPASLQAGKLCSITRRNHFATICKVRPAQYMSHPLAQDDSNYLQGRKLTPGCRIESGLGESRPRL